MEAQQVTFKNLLISVLIRQVAQTASVDIINQPFASESLKNIAEAITLLKQSEICLITEQEINEVLVKMHLEGLIQQITHE